MVANAADGGASYVERGRYRIRYVLGQSAGQPPGFVTGASTSCSLRTPLYHGTLELNLG